MAELVALTYGKALFDVAKEVDKVKVILEEIGFINKSFVDDPDFFELYRSPRISTNEKKDIMNKIFKNQVSDEVINFLYVLLDKKRENAFFDIHKEYTKLANEYHNIAEVTIYSAKKLSDDQIKELEKGLSEAIKKGIQLNVIIDPSLIGGLKVKIGDKVVDNTIQLKLKNLKEIIDSIII